MSSIHRELRVANAELLFSLPLQNLPKNIYKNELICTKFAENVVVLPCSVSRESMIPHVSLSLLF